MLVMSRLKKCIILLIQGQSRRKGFIMSGKFEFYYGTMGNGKTREVFKVWHSKKEDGFYAVIMKPSKDKKGDNSIVSRDGESIPVDFLIEAEDNIYNIIAMYLVDNNLDTILVDEVQFFSKEQIKQLSNVVDILGIDVICYGLLTDSRSILFDGSKALIEWGAELFEIKGQCRCGNKNSHNARFIDGEFVLDGEQVAIDGVDATYRAVCRQCYKKLVRNNHKK